MGRAEEILRVKLGGKASKAASRITAEGVVAAYIAGNVGALVEINSETDFVAKNDDFLAMANLAAKLVAENNPADVSALAAIPHDGKTFDDVRTALIGKIGENMTVRRFQRFETTGKLASYLHGNRIGVIVDYDGADEQVGKDVAMHIAAMKPVSLSSEQVPAELIEKERSVAQLKAKEDADKAVAEGKQPQSADIVAKRIDGSVQKYLKEVSLLNQAFVKNDKVLTLSVHHAAPGFYPAIPLASLTAADAVDPFTLSLPLQAGASNATFVRVWTNIVSKVIGSFDPDYLVVQCGLDGLAGDPYAVWNWGIDVDDQGSLGWCIQELVNSNRKMVLLGGGKYRANLSTRA